MSTRDSTRTRLLDATDALVLAGGDLHTPVDRILERAGVSPATLYRAYGSKEALVAAALTRRHEDWLAVWDAAVERASTDRDRLLAVFDALEAFQSRPDGARWCAFLGTAAAYAEPPPVLAEAVRLDSDSLRRRLRALARPVVADRAKEVAEELLLVFTGHLAMRLRPGARRSARRARELGALVVDRVAAATS